MHREHMISFCISLRSCAIQTFHWLELISANVLTYILAIHICVVGSWQHKISFLPIISHNGMLFRYFFVGVSIQLNAYRIPTQITSIALNRIVPHICRWICLFFHFLYWNSFDTHKYTTKPPQVCIPYFM